MTLCLFILARACLVEAGCSPFNLYTFQGKTWKEWKGQRVCGSWTAIADPAQVLHTFNRAWSSTATNHVDVEALNTNITHCLLPLIHLPRCFLLCVFSFLGYGWESSWCQDCSERFYRIGLNTSCQIFLLVNISEFFRFFWNTCWLFKRTTPLNKKRWGGGQIYK